MPPGGPKMIKKSFTYFLKISITGAFIFMMGIAYTRNHHTIKNFVHNNASLIKNKIRGRYTEFPFIQSNYKRRHKAEQPMVIVIPSYNNALWYAQNLKSIFKQKYSNYRIIYIADGCGSPNYDGTAELVEQYIATHHMEDKVTLIKNYERRGALYNLYHAIHSCDDDEIIITVDGDDALAHDQVLAALNDFYTDKDIWLTHGSFIEYPTGAHRWSENIPAHIINSNEFRSFKCASHLRTFKAWLFKEIKEEDLKYNGEFYTMTWDQAIMFPMCEMAGERQIFLDIVYVYNVANQINDCKVNAQLQRDLEKHIRAMPKYSKLNQRPIKS